MAFGDSFLQLLGLKSKPVETKGLTISGEYSDGFIPRESWRALASWGLGDGDGLNSNVIMAPVMWVMRTFTEAQARVQRRTDKMWDWVEDHAVEILIDQPNDAYDGDAIWKGTCISFILQGDAYWRKIRNRFGDVIALWYVPHWLMRPISPLDGSVFISHYEFTHGHGTPTQLDPRDVVHFRFGLDPRDPRHGYSPLRPLLQEIFTDDEAATFSAKILENMGVPGLMVSPKNENFKPSKEEQDKLTAYLKTAFSGQNRGAPMVMGIPTDVAQFGFDPNKLMLGNLRDIAEERVCAALGLPAAVVGFGSGLQSTKVGATMRELRRLAWVQCLIPMQKSLARQLTSQLLPDFVAQTRRFRVRFDTTDVSAFQEEEDLRAERVTKMVQGGVLRIDRAQDMLGLEVDDSQKVYLRPSNSIAIDEHGKLVEGATPNGAVTPGSGNGSNDVPPAIAARMNGNGANAGEE